MQKDERMSEEEPREHTHTHARAHIFGRCLAVIT